MTFLVYLRIFLLYLFDLFEFTQTNRKKRIPAKIIQKNWKLYIYKRNWKPKVTHLDFNHPIKELIWTIKNQPIQNWNNYLSY